MSYYFLSAFLVVVAAGFTVFILVHTLDDINVAATIVSTLAFTLAFALPGVLAALEFARKKKSNVRWVLLSLACIHFISFLTFLAIFLWSYFHPGMLMLAEGGINLIILIVMVAGVILNLICGAVVHFILSRWEGNK